MGKHKTNWEPIGIIVIVILMGGGFLAALAAVLRPASPGGAEPETVSGAPRAWSWSRIMPRRALSMRDTEDSWDLYAARATSAEDYALLVPAGKVDAKANFFPLVNGGIMAEPSRLNQNRKKDKEDEEEETGWGWLADDIEANRKEKKASSGDATGERQAEEGDERERETPDPASGEAQKEPPVFFIDQSYQSDASNISGSKTDGRGGDIYGPGSEMKGVERLGAEDGYFSSRSSSGLESGIGPGELDSSPSRGESAFSGDRYSSAVLDQSDNSWSSYRDADASAGFSSYRSSSMFDTGSRYEGSGMDAGGLGPLFSGSDVSQGSRGPGFTSLGFSDQEGRLSVGRDSSFIRSPSSASGGSEGGRWGEEGASPRALPW